MIKKILISALVVIAFVAIIFVGAKNYHEKIQKDNIIIAREKVKAANENHELSLLNEAKELLQNVDGEEKEELLKAIEKVEEDIAKERVLNKYVDKINKLKEDYSLEKLEDLKEEINDVEYEDVKLELLEKIDNIGKETKEEKEEDKEVLETLTGVVSAYTTKEKTLASGKTVGENTSYKDQTYGEVYIVKGDVSYPYGTIIRIKDVSFFEEDIYAIVLDRGENVGKENKILFDILLKDDKEVRGFGSEKNITCEVLRLGF